MSSKRNRYRGIVAALKRLRLPSLHALWRLWIALAVSLSFSLTMDGPSLHAEEDWPHLPSDAEILQLRNQFVAEYTFSTPHCGSKCDPGLPEFDLKMCVAKACAGEYFAGPEVRQSAVTETEIIKAHDPHVRNPVAASYVFLLSAQKMTLQHTPNSSLVEVVDYRIRRIAYGISPDDKMTYHKWYWTTNGLEYDVMQDDATSRAQRDAVVDSYFKPGRLVRGFPGAKAGEIWDLGGRKPCPEAVKFYSLDPNRTTAIQFDYADMQEQFEQALQKYEGNNRHAYAQDSILGTVPALAWLANQGGTIDAMNKQFVFTSDADREKWKNKVPRPDQVTPGNERSLYEAMFKAAKGGQKLTPGDVFYLALVERNGDAKEAMLLAHNTLRSLARIVDRGVLGNDDQTATQVEFNPNFIREHLMPLVSPEPLGDGQNSGAWYHLFGVTYFEMQARGTWGAYTLVQLSGDKSSDDLNEKAQEMLRIIAHDPELKIPANRSKYSALSNEIEQLARKYFFGSADDPMKYCYNVWGAQLGAWLYKDRLDIKPAIQLPESPPADITIPTLFGPVPLDSRPSGYTVHKNDPDTWISASPMTITWENSQHKMVLDQQSNSLFGYFPINLFLFYEEDTDTWGTIWVQTGTDDYRVTLEATQDGWAHLTRSGKGETQVYPIALTAGERLTLDTSASSPAPSIVRATGEEIAPLDISSAVAVTPASDPTSWITLATLAVVALGALAVALRRRGASRRTTQVMRAGRRTAVAPSAPPMPRAKPESPGAPCPACGAASRPGARFCRSCGHALSG